MVAIKKKHVPLKTKMGYGLAEIASCIVTTLFAVYGLFYLTDIRGFSPSFGGAIVALGMLSAGVVNPIVGVVSDNLRSKWGRRRPFMLVIAIPQSLVVWLFFANIHFSSQVYAKVYYIILVLLYFFFNTLLETPHLALSAEMTQDYNERTNILAWRSFMGQIGSILGGTVFMLIYEHMIKTKTSSFSASMTVGVLSILCVPLILVSWYSTKGTELFPKENRFHFKDVVSGPLSNRSFIFLTAAFSLAMSCIYLNGAVGVYYLSYVLEMTKKQVSIVMFILFGLSILWIPVIDIICTRLGKCIGWTIFMGMWAIFGRCFYPISA